MMVAPQRRNSSTTVDLPAPMFPVSATESMAKGLESRVQGLGLLPTLDPRPQTRTFVPLLSRAKTLHELRDAAGVDRGYQRGHVQRQERRAHSPGAAGKHPPAQSGRLQITSR